MGKTQEIKLLKAKSTAIYAHIPFCARNCGYCKFYKVFPSISDISFYIENLEREAGKFFAENPDFTAHSVYFGGGTPTCLSEKDLLRVCKIFERFVGEIEWTVEAAPSTISPSKLKMLKDCGVNRISIGVQSFNQKTLDSLGRPHALKAAFCALENAANIFENVNIDLIFGAQNQTLSEWQADLEKAVKMPVKHISAYCLEFENATALCAGNVKPFAQQEKEVDFLNLAISALQDAGFLHYEISNYCKMRGENGDCEISKSANSQNLKTAFLTPREVEEKTYACKHNLNTWQMGEWLGLGAAAASQIGDVRRRNPYSLKEWAKNVENNWQNSEDIVRLDDEELFSSAVIFGLRMMAGISLAELKRRYPLANHAKYESIAARLQKEGFLETKNGYLRLTKESIALADSVAAEFL